MNRLAALVFMAFAAASFATPPKLTIPEEVRPVGGYAHVTPDTDAKSVTYVGLSGVDGFPSDLLKDSRRFLLPVSGLKAGRYRFAAVAASAAGEQVRADFTVVVGEPGPDKPVIPPVVPVDPVVPTDRKDAELLAKMKEGFALDKDDDKAGWAKKLAVVYRAGADPAFLATCKSVRQVDAAMNAASQAAGTRTHITWTRKVLRDYLDPLLPLTDLNAPMTEDRRKLSAEEYGRVARMLEVLK